MNYHLQNLQILQRIIQGHGNIIISRACNFLRTNIVIHNSSSSTRSMSTFTQQQCHNKQKTNLYKVTASSFPYPLLIMKELFAGSAFCVFHVKCSMQRANWHHLCWYNRFDQQPITLCLPGKWLNFLTISLYFYASKSTLKNWMKTPHGMEWTVEADLLIIPNSTPSISHWTIVFNLLNI